MITPKHPTALPDEVVKAMTDLAAAHGYGVDLLRLSWVTTLGNPQTARVDYASDLFGGKTDVPRSK